MEGDVFGCFTGKSWRNQFGYFGSGDAFLWRLKKSRWGTHQPYSSARVDSELEVYPCTGYDNMVQLFTTETIAVGGGPWDDGDSPYEPRLNGIGLIIDRDLLCGESKSCATFANPPLCKNAEDGVSFEIINLEVWTLTPCMTTESANELEARNLFVEKNMKLL